MRILGVDPGYAIVGYGALDARAGQLCVLEYGAVTTPAHTPLTDRLNTIYTDMRGIIDRVRPDCMALEKLFVGYNTTTAIAVAAARGVILLAASQAGLKLYEYTPNEVKQAIVGYGKAEKHQMMEMTRILLGLPSIPRPDDTADALAMAVCCGHSVASPMYNP